jgi:hypothetical protein
MVLSWWVRLPRRRGRTGGDARDAALALPLDLIYCNDLPGTGTSRREQGVERVRSDRSSPQRRPLLLGSIASVAVAGCRSWHPDSASTPGRATSRTRKRIRRALRLALDMSALTACCSGPILRGSSAPPRIGYPRENPTEDWVEQILHSNVATDISLPASPGGRKGRDVTCAIGRALVNARCAADPRPTRSSAR